MKKTIIFLVLILLFSCPSIQAEMSMKIISRNIRSHEGKAVADNEEINKVTETREIEGPIEVVDAKEVAEASKAREAITATAVIETVEIKKVVAVAEAEETIEEKKVVDPAAVIESTVATETKVVVEALKKKEIAPVDYKSLGLRSVELNPNDYPDEVIALLEPHKDSENNDSVLFYSSLGLAYKSKGRLKDAIAAYKRALGIVPNVPAPAIQYNLGIAYYHNNEFHKSFNCFLNSSAQRSDHPGTKKWIIHLAGELNIYKVPDTSKLKLVVNKKMNINRKKTDRESRLRIYLTQDGGRIQELSVKDKIYSYGIDSDTESPVDYIIIDSDGDGDFDKVISTKGKFGVPTWAYNPD